MGFLCILLFSCWFLQDYKSFCSNRNTLLLCLFTCIRSCKACWKFQEKLQSVASRACCNFQAKLQSVASRARACCKFQEKLQSVASRACCNFQAKLQSVLEVPREVAKRSIKSKSVLQVPTWRRQHDVISPPPPPLEKMICVLVWEREGLMSILIYGRSNTRYLIVALIVVLVGDS